MTKYIHKEAFGEVKCESLNFIEYTEYILT